MAASTPERDLPLSPPPASDAETIDFGVVLAEPTTKALTLTVEERIALGTHGLRKNVAIWMTIAFITINGFVMCGLYLALRFDFKMIDLNRVPYVPFISEKVIMSLLGATTIQLGAITFTMAKFLFPNKSNGV